MRTNFIFYFLLASQSVFAQDGTDIRYLKTSMADSSLKGIVVHLDFYRRSYMGLNCDTITLTIKNRPVRFVEVRKDDGYNNWFSQQSLRALDDVEGIKLNIESWQVVEVASDSILVRPDFEFILPKGSLFDPKSWERDYWFDKHIICEILIKSKPLGSLP